MEDTIEIRISVPGRLHRFLQAQRQRLGQASLEATVIELIEEAQCRGEPLGETLTEYSEEYWNKKRADLLRRLIRHREQRKQARANRTSGAGLVPDPGLADPNRAEGRGDRGRGGGQPQEGRGLLGGGSLGLGVELGGGLDPSVGNDRDAGLPDAPAPHRASGLGPNVYGECV